MSKIGNYLLGIQESKDYRIGWEKAERGEPLPCYREAMDGEDLEDLHKQRVGWFHYQSQGEL